MVDLDVIGRLFDGQQQREELWKGYAVQSKVDGGLLVALDNNGGLRLHADDAIANLRGRRRFFHEGQQRKLGRWDWHALFELGDTRLLGYIILRNKGKFLAEEERAEYAEILEDVEEGIKRVQNIVSDLRAFTHPDVVQLDHVEVDQIVASALRFLSNEWKDQVEIVQDLPANQTIWANQSKLTQVVVNLLQNSLDAIKTKSFAEGKPTIWIEGRADVARSALIIRDNGEGIDPLVMGKIFDPFFTTKDVGRGMGLGLSICYRIIHDFEGKISVRSEPGKFCEFKLEFPSRQKT